MVTAIIFQQFFLTYNSFLSLSKQHLKETSKAEASQEKSIKFYGWYNVVILIFYLRRHHGICFLWIHRHLSRHDQSPGVGTGRSRPGPHHPRPSGGIYGPPGRSIHCPDRCPKYLTNRHGGRHHWAHAAGNRCRSALAMDRHLGVLSCPLPFPLPESSPFRPPSPSGLIFGGPLPWALSSQGVHLPALLPHPPTLI